MKKRAIHRTRISSRPSRAIQLYSAIQRYTLYSYTSLDYTTSTTPVWRRSVLSRFMTGSLVCFTTARVPRRPTPDLVRQVAAHAGKTGGCTRRGEALVQPRAGWPHLVSRAQLPRRHVSHTLCAVVDPEPLPSKPVPIPAHLCCAGTICCRSPCSGREVATT